MGRQNGPSYNPSVQMTTPVTAYGSYQPQQQQPIVVVQPPAQYITVNSGPPYSNYEPVRSTRTVQGE